MQKVLAQAGVASRRQAEELITSGKVKVNGKVVSVLGTRVREKDRIEVEQMPVERETTLRYYLLNKPVGVISTARDERGRKKVLDLLENVPVRVYPAGRLDFDTSGLLLLTNDGELTYRLTHPRFGVEKTYIAGVTGEIDPQRLGRLRRGVMLEDGKTAPAKVRYLGTDPRRGLELLEITIHEGRNRQVRRMCQAVGLTVTTLKRTRFASLVLNREVASGEYRQLTAQEIQSLRQQVSL
ncbi:MAG: rRNA pseudouridine synthase [Peptococcaceae bacterium]|nr:rRNA pseudouridine synthase [Peptococcaceae bacterium]